MIQREILYDLVVIVQSLSSILLCDLMDYWTPGSSVLHYLLELAQIHVHWVGEAIQPSHPLSFSSPSAFNLSKHQGLFWWVSSLHQVAKVLEFQLQHQSVWWIFRVDFLQNWLIWSPCSPRDSQQSSPTPKFKSINSSVLSLLYGPTLISVHDHWKNHSFDYMDLEHDHFSWKPSSQFPDFWQRSKNSSMEEGQHFNKWQWNNCTSWARKWPSTLVKARVFGKGQGPFTGELTGNRRQPCHEVWGRACEARREICRHFEVGKFGTRI